MHPNLSVVICTLNRAEKLRNAVYSLALQTYPQNRFEVIVVDNGSTDHTGAVVRDFQASGRLRIKALYCDREGLSSARNMGVAGARGAVIAFLDDDALACRSWLTHVMAMFDGDPGLDAMGGPVEALAEPPFHRWMPKRLKPYLSVVNYGNRPKYLKYPRYPFGTNMAFRRGVFTKWGLFDTRLGRAAKRPFQTGEETDFFLRLEKGGARIGYHPQARVYHTLHTDRLRPEWFFGQAHGIGISFAVMERKSFSSYRMLFKILAAFGLLIAGYGGWVCASAAKHARSMVYFKCLYCERWGYVKTIFFKHTDR